jgi:hypothetical protein
MKIVLITPAGPTAHTGNRIAGARWARILRALGHRVRIATDYDGAPADLMVAVHAWRSAAAIAAFKSRHPQRPVVLQLSGTDIYGYLASDPVPTLRSMELADRLVALNDLAWRVVPKRLRPRLRVIHQSAEPPARERKPATRGVLISVIGHLRDVKDPLRAAEAARLLPAGSRVRIEQVGGAYTAEWAERAEAEMKTNPRYRGRQAAGAQPRHGDLVAERRRRQRHLRSGRRRRAPSRVAHGRQCRSAGERLPGVFSGRRHRGPRKLDATGRMRSPIRSPPSQGRPRTRGLVRSAPGGRRLAPVAEGNRGRPAAVTALQALPSGPPDHQPVAGGWVATARKNYLGVDNLIT